MPNWDGSSVVAGNLLSATPSPMPVKRLVQIRVLVEVDSNAEVERLAEAFEAAICPHPGGSDHRCPMRWFIVTSELGEEELHA